MTSVREIIAGWEFNGEADELGYRLADEHRRAIAEVRG